MTKRGCVHLPPLLPPPVLSPPPRPPPTPIFPPHQLPPQINDREELTLIDFPQMVSVGHPNAQELFDRDVDCIIRFFT